MNPSSFAILSLVFTSEHISGQPTGPQPTGQQPIDVECCKEKTVGGVGYLHVEQGEVPAECKSRCIYSRVDNPNSRFCFAVGDLPVTCGFPPETCSAVLTGNGTCKITYDNCEFGWPFAAPPFCNCECLLEQPQSLKDETAEESNCFPRDYPGQGCPPLRDLRIIFQTPWSQTSQATYTDCFKFCQENAPKCNAWTYADSGPQKTHCFLIDSTPICYNAGAQSGWYSGQACIN